MYDIPIKQKKSTKLTLKEEENRLELIKKENVDKIHDILINSKNLYEDLSILYPNLKGNRHLMMARTINDLYRNKNLQNILFGEEFDSIKEEIIATGGEITDIVDSGKRYRVHTFKSSSNFNVYKNNLEVEYLVVAGGGGGGSGKSNGAGTGGGGAGGLLKHRININKNIYSIIIGSGGTGGSVDNPGNNGSNSSFNNIISIGGGGGGSVTSGTNKSGGSGGGSGRYSPISTGISGQGNDGGLGNDGTPYRGGGGGGSDSLGINGIVSGNGGNGKSINIDGIFKYYAAGGGGGTYNSGNGGIGGNNIGGNGGNGSSTVANNGTNAVINTGSGGGGGNSTDTGYTPGIGGNGGSGIVIIRYELKNSIIDNLFKKIVATGGNITEIIDNNQRYRVHTFTSSGNFELISDRVEVEYLVVAGGGGGGVCYGGGGGAGGYRSNVKGELSGGNSQSESPMFINKGNYSVVIGAGGNNRVNISGNGFNGNNSSFNNIISIGGGYGGGECGNIGGDGGSGGGGSGTGAVSKIGGNKILNQGYNGNSSINDGGGGGGGAGNGNISLNRQGNNGLQSKINGILTYYAGGGSGSGSTSLNGGLGGGGLGGTSLAVNIANAIINTGGGGGGTIISSVGVSGKGGSGIVIIRYPIDNNPDNHIVNSYTDIIGVQDDGTRSSNGAGLRQVIFNNSKLDLTTKDTAYFDNHRSYRFSDYYDTAGNVFVKIPISYWWRGMLPDIVDGTTPRWTMLLSPYPITKTINGVNCTFTASPSTFNHNTKGWLPHFYIGKYRGSDDGTGTKVASKQGAAHWGNVSFNNFRTYCSNNGADYHMLSLFEWHEILARMVIEKCTFQLMPEATRAVQASCVYRGINDFAFGPTTGVYVELMDGIRTDASGNFEIWNTSDGNYISTGKNCIIYTGESDYYCQSLYSEMDNLFISATNGTNATSFIPDLAGMRGSGNVSKVCSVSFYSSAVYSGAFYVDFDKSSTGAASSIGCRLSKW